MSIDTLTDMVRNHKIHAYTLDTNVVEHHGFRFKSLPLSAVTEYGELNFLLTDVVCKEIQRHYLEPTRQRIQQAISVLKKHSGQTNELTAPVGLLGNIDFGKILPLHCSEFFSRASDILTATDHVDIDQVLTNYFEIKPPFAEGNKKTEFPDAIALSTLENWAKEESKTVLVVTADKGWVEFCKESSCLYSFEGIAKHADTSNKKVLELALSILQSLRVDDYEHLMQFKTLLKDHEELREPKVSVKVKTIEAQSGRELSAATAVTRH